jgi:hypothetical protein
MSQQNRPPSTSGVLFALGGIMTLIPIILVLLVILVAIIIGAGPYGYVTAAVIAVVVFGVVRASRTWRCGNCRRTFRAGAAECPHCHVRIAPPR